MAKPRTPNQRKRYAALNKRLAKYVSLVQSMYDILSDEAAAIVSNTTDYSVLEERPFHFKDYPHTRVAFDNLIKMFADSLNGVIYSGTSEEWTNSNLVQDLLANDVLRAYNINRGDERVRRYYQTNSEALRAFQRRKDKGLNVSQKVWKQSYAFKKELEAAISTAIERGQSAITLSKRISQYLHDFPSLQKDYTERYGRAADCKNCEYQSIRLACSEINMAYREAEQERWRQMDFIKGKEIKLSHSHPRPDICDILAGVYPLWFNWTGWHTLCLDYAIPIIMTDDEWYSKKGTKIDTLPDNFIAWARENRDRLYRYAESETAPYWVRDNLKAVLDASEPYKLNSDDAEILIERGFDYLEPREFNASPIAGFDLIKFDDDISAICDSTDITINSKRCTIYDDRVIIEYFGENELEEDFSMERTFMRERGKINVYHDLLEIPDSLQGTGIGKVLMRDMVSQYLQMGADQINIFANINIGGYAWGRYGFSAIGLDEVEQCLKSSNAGVDIVNAARGIVERFYATHNEDTPFPMNMLASQPWGRDLLLGNKISWFGILDLNDKKAVSYLKHYIGL